MTCFYHFLDQCGLADNLILQRKFKDMFCTGIGASSYFSHQMALSDLGVKGYMCVCDAGIGSVSMRTHSIYNNMAETCKTQNHKHRLF